jgi:hypothetical protein
MSCIKAPNETAIDANADRTKSNATIFVVIDVQAIVSKA